MYNDTDKSHFGEELDCWFNELNDNTIEIINTDDCKKGEPSIICDEKNSEDYSKCICIDDIIKKKQEFMPSNEIIQYECSISHYIQALMEELPFQKSRFHDRFNKLPSFDILQSIKEYLEWISKACEILAKRINQELLEHKTDNKDKPKIVRSSYNFCKKYTQCKNFYSRYEPPTCKEHHYVHSILKYDVDSVINFLSYIIKNKIDMTIEELDDLRLSIKTISYVTRHMSKEISYINYITKNNSETFHRNNPIEIRKKKFSKVKDHLQLRDENGVSYRNELKTNNNLHVMKQKSNRGYTQKKRNIMEDNNEFSENRFSVLSNININELKN